MDDVEDLVVTPFRDIVEKGKTAIGNAGDNEPMIKAATALVKEGERALRRIEPLCKKHVDDYGSNFIISIKENGMLPTRSTQIRCNFSRADNWLRRRYRGISYRTD